MQSSWALEPYDSMIMDFIRNTLLTKKNYNRKKKQEYVSKTQSQIDYDHSKTRAVLDLPKSKSWLANTIKQDGQIRQPINVF